MDFELAIDAKAFFRFLLKVIFALIALNLIWQFLYLSFDQYIPFLSTIAWWFNVDYEGTIPSAYSSLTLFFCAFLLAVITFFKRKTNNRYTLHWGTLGLLFLFAGWDEATQIHEKLIDSGITLKLLELFGVEPEGIFAFGNWVVVALPLVCLVALLYSKFFFSLPRSQRYLFLLSALLFFSGALLTELVGSWIWQNSGGNLESLPYILATTVEEGLEMFGVAVFIYALLRYLDSMLNSLKLNFQSGAERSLYYSNLPTSQL